MPNDSRNPFILAVLVPLIFDHVITVLGQPSEYWKDFSFAQEGSPARFLLAQHPAWFFLWGAAYAVLIVVLLRVLPKKAALPLGLLVYMGHAWGSATWIPGSWYVFIAYFAILSLVLSWGILSWFRNS